MSVFDLAKGLDVSRQQLHRILAKTAPITPEMALRIGKFCGNGSQLWLRIFAGPFITEPASHAAFGWDVIERARDFLTGVPQSSVTA
jgi:hypothetical protein